jgi:hypothetical protein
VISSIFIGLAIVAALFWGEDFLLAPQWLRITLQVLVALTLFGLVAWESS